MEIPANILSPKFKIKPLHFLIGFVILSFLIAFLIGGFVLGQNQSKKDKFQAPSITQTPTPKPTSIDDRKIFCTQEAKRCPDGTWVGRTGPNCEFSKCP